MLNKKVFTGLAITLVGVAASSGVAGAEDVRVSPTSAGMPGSDAIGTLVNWLGQLALLGGLAAILAGGAMFGWTYWNGNSGGQNKATKMIMGAGVAALTVAVGPEVINTLSKL